MPKDRLYDFSQESGLKPKLLEKLKTEYAKSHQAMLADDELDLVAAAGSSEVLPVCPYGCSCTACPWFNGGCTKHMIKAEGGDGCV